MRDDYGYGLPSAAQSRVRISRAVPVTDQESALRQSRSLASRERSKMNTLVSETNTPPQSRS